VIRSQGFIRYHKLLQNYEKGWCNNGQMLG